jgi:uncharacterized protein
LADFGLSENVIIMLKDVFKKYPSVEIVKVFGSRAKGNYRLNSDVDFVLWGNINDMDLGKISLDLDDLPTPYKFDVKLYSQISHLKLKNHIDRVGKTFYKKNTGKENV